MLSLLFVAVLLFSLVSCSDVGKPITEGKDENGIDSGIEWYHRVEAYPTYGVDRQRYKHYYTDNVTSQEIDEYILSLTDEGYVCMDASGEAQANGVRYPVGEYEGDVATYTFTYTNGEEVDTVVLTYIFLYDGTWHSEVDS